MSDSNNGVGQQQQWSTQTNQSNAQSAAHSIYWIPEGDPTWFGFFIWYAVTAVIDMYPEQNPTPQDQHNIREFFKNLVYFFPCPDECRPHFQEMLQRWPVPVSDRSTMAEWWRFLHNQVNIRLNKPVLTSPEARQHLYALQHTDWNKVWSDLKQEFRVPQPKYTLLKSEKPWYRKPSTWRIFVEFLLCLIVIAVVIQFLREPSVKSQNDPINPVNHINHSSINKDHLNIAGPNQGLNPAQTLQSGLH